MPQVMVVEDSRFIRYLLRKNLSYLEMKIAGECSQHDEALSMYQTLKPDVVLIDHSLPETDALSLTEALLGLDIYAKVILMIPLRMAKEAQGLIAIGVKAVIIKPFYPEILQSTLIEVTVGL